MIFIKGPDPPPRRHHHHFPGSDQNHQALLSWLLLKSDLEREHVLLKGERLHHKTLALFGRTCIYMYIGNFSEWLRCGLFLYYTCPDLVNCRNHQERKSSLQSGKCVLRRPGRFVQADSPLNSVPSCHRSAKRARQSGGQDKPNPTPNQRWNGSHGDWGRLKCSSRISKDSKKSKKNPRPPPRRLAREIKACFVWLNRYGTWLAGWQ